MSGMNARLAAMAGRMIQNEGFEVAIQGKTEATGDFDTTAPAWTTAHTVKAIWDQHGRQWERLQDGRPASQGQMVMYVEYLDALKDTKSAAALRVVYQGVAYNIAGATIVGANIASRLLLEDGVPA